MISQLLLQHHAYMPAARLAASHDGDDDGLPLDHTCCSPLYMCSRLTTWDWVTHQRAHFWRKLVLLLPVLIDSLVLRLAAFLNMWVATRSRISDIYIIIHNSNKITVMK